MPDVPWYPQSESEAAIPATQRTEAIERMQGLMRTREENYKLNLKKTLTIIPKCSQFAGRKTKVGCNKILLKEMLSLQYMQLYKEY